MNYIGINTCDMTNGPGIRVSLFVSGCRFHCKNCFNKEAWNFNAGKPFTEETIRYIRHALDEEYISGLSILGGEPLEPEHRKALLDLLEDFWLFHPDKNVWLWTGHKFEDIKDNHILDYVDVLVDGAFIEHKKDPDLIWRGSSNQRIISLKPEPKDISKEIDNEYSTS